jgi:hypothetical protein
LTGLVFLTGVFATVAFSTGGSFDDSAPRRPRSRRVTAAVSCGRRAA